MKPWKMSFFILTGSLVLTCILWMIDLPFLFVCFLVPFIPFLSGQLKIRRCPVCGWESAGSERFCPYDATPLVDSEECGSRIKGGR